MELPVYHVRLKSALHCRLQAWRRAVCWLGCFALCARLGTVEGAAAAVKTTPASTPAETAGGSAAATGPQATATMYIREYAVTGAKSLSRNEIEEAVYPYLGPGRTPKDLELAKAAIEKVYEAKGMRPFLNVEVPEQSFKGGLVIIKVTEGQVGSLHVLGAKYYLPSHVRKHAQSLAEGKVLKTPDIERDMIALGQFSADRTVTPKLNARPEEAGVYDIELHVKDKLPLHGSVELNNRKSADTTDLRLNANLSYANLWQRGHSIGGSFQTSPEDRSEVKVYSAYYIWRFETLDWLSVMFTGTKQDSNVSTLGGIAVAGRGEIVGARAIVTLPGVPGNSNFYHSMNFGLDYKSLDQNVVVAGVTDVTPIHYYPFTIGWDGTWLHNRMEPNPDKPGELRRVDLGTTALSLSTTMHFRGMGSTATSLERNRFGADGSFFFLRGDLSHEHELPGGWQAYGKIQGQAANQPLVNSEQIGGGGMGTVRGYLEAEALGDSGIFGTVEIRTPSLLRMERVRDKTDQEMANDASGGLTVTEKTGSEWRFYAFFDAGTLGLQDALPGQEDSFRLASFGLGSQIQFRNHLHGIVELALPLTSLTTTQANEPRINFRLWMDF